MELLGTEPGILATKPPGAAPEGEGHRGGGTAATAVFGEGIPVAYQWAQQQCHCLWRHGAGLVQKELAQVRAQAAEVVHHERTCFQKDARRLTSFGLNGFCGNESAKVHLTHDTSRERQEARCYTDAGGQACRPKFLQEARLDGRPASTSSARA